MPVSQPGERGVSHEGLIAGSRLNFESWDPQLRRYLTRHARVYSFMSVVSRGRMEETSELFPELRGLGKRILVVPHSLLPVEIRRKMGYDSVIQCEYPIAFAEVLLEVSDSHERITIRQQSPQGYVNSRDVFTYHFSDREGVRIDLVPRRIDGAQPSPLRLVIKR